MTYFINFAKVHFKMLFIVVVVRPLRFSEVQRMVCIVISKIDNIRIL